MKKIEVLKFFIVALTIWAFDAFISYSILLLNLRRYKGLDGYNYPLMYYSIPFWLGISLMFLFIPVLLWVWYYFEIHKIRKYYQNLAVNGNEIIATAYNEIENLISRGILSKKDADAKINQLILEYENEIFVKKSINEEQEKLNSLNSLNRLKAIDDEIYQTEKGKIKDEISMLKKETGLGIKFIEINKYVASSFFDTPFLYISIFIFGIVPLLPIDAKEKIAEGAYLQHFTLQFILLIIGFLLKKYIYRFDKNQRNFWNKTDEEE